MKLTIWGAARQVTGSMHLLETENYSILVDCGLDYEKDTWVEENEQFPFSPAEIDLVILTHAHIDHSGNLPTLVRLGFEGQILCTAPTADLTELLLLDSVNIFLSRQRKTRKGKKGFSTGPRCCKTTGGRTLASAESRRCSGALHARARQTNHHLATRAQT